MRVIALPRILDERSVRWIARFYPLAILLVALQHVSVHARALHYGDEWRYLWYAKNLTHGYFTPRDNEMIWNGPGYPLLLVPFVATGAPELWAKYLNAVLLALAVLYVHQTLLLFCSRRRALLGGLFVGLSPLPYQTLHLLYTESFSLFLMAGTLYHFSVMRRAKARRHAVVAGLYAGALALTKILFGPVIFGALLVTGGLWLLGRRTRRVERSLAMLGIACALCVPWLVYTHSVSGKWFYWASGSGLLIYWMTTPYPDELGEGLHHGWVMNRPYLYARHGKFFQHLIGDPKSYAGTELDRALPGLGRISSVHADDEFWHAAIEQLKAHPEAYARKWCFNVCRLFFDYPYALKFQVDFRLVALHAVLLVLVGLVLVRRLTGRLRLSPELMAIGIVTLVATAASTALGAGVRYFLPYYPPYVLLALAGTAPHRYRVRGRASRAERARQSPSSARAGGSLRRA